MATLSLENTEEITFDETVFFTQTTATDSSRAEVVVRYGYPMEGGVYCTFLLEQALDGEILRCWRVGDILNEESSTTVEELVDQIFQGLI